MTDDNRASCEPIQKKRLLWCSDRDAKETVDYYADKLWLLKLDDGKWALRLEVGGTVVTQSIVNIDKYI